MIHRDEDFLEYVLGSRAGSGEAELRVTIERSLRRFVVYTLLTSGNVSDGGLWVKRILEA
jgi:hypothetical protein